MQYAAVPGAAHRDHQLSVWRRGSKLEVPSGMGLPSGCGVARDGGLKDVVAAAAIQSSQ